MCKVCNCKDGVRELTVTIETGPDQLLPVALDNLEKVTCLVYSKKFNTIGLLVEYSPELKKGYDAINLNPGKPKDKGNIGEGGLDVIRYLLEAITGQPFIQVPVEIEGMICYRRKDRQEEIEKFIKENKDKEV